MDNYALIFVYSECLFGEVPHQFNIKEVRRIKNDRKVKFFIWLVFWLGISFGMWMGSEDEGLSIMSLNEALSLGGDRYGCAEISPIRNQSGQIIE